MGSRLKSVVYVSSLHSGGKGGKTFFQGALSFALCRIYHTHWLLLTLL